MRKLIAVTALLAATGFALPAMAQTGSSSSSSSASVTASADLVCLSTAVEARENAVIAAKTKFDAAVMVALQARRDALKAALTITNNHDRQVALNAAWKTYMDAVIKARAQYKTDIKAAWKVYIAARANCHVDTAEANVRKIPKILRKFRDDDNDDKKHEQDDVRVNGSANVMMNMRGRGLGTDAHLDLSF